MKRIYETRNKFHKLINDPAQINKPPLSKNFPQYTTLTDEDTYCNLTWIGFCKSINATPSVHYSYTIVGGVSKTRLQTRNVDGRQERYTSFGSETTPAHWHAPPVMNLALSGSCKKLYKLVSWEHMTGIQKTSNTSKIEELQESNGHVYTATLGMREAANCILLPPKMLHEITTVGLDTMKAGDTVYDFEDVNRHFYLGFGTYFALNDSDFMQDVQNKLNNQTSLIDYFFSNQKLHIVVINNDNVQLSVNSANSGEGNEKIKAEFNSENLNVSFNSKYLIDIASEVEDKNLKMNLKDSVSPVLSEDASDKNSYYVIMPMKI